MIRLYQAQDLPQAQLILDLLDQNHIKALLQNTNASAAMGEVPFTHAYPEVWLTDEKDLDQAKQLIAQFEQAATDEQWLCPCCQECSPVTFDFCWACDSPRDLDG